MQTHYIRISTALGHGKKSPGQARNSRRDGEYQKFEYADVVADKSGPHLVLFNGFDDFTEGRMDQPPQGNYHDAKKEKG